MDISTSTNNIYSIFWNSSERRWVFNIALVVLGSFALAISAQLSIPLFPVPVSLQSLAILFIAMTYGSRLGLATAGLYLLEGALGVPVFANFSAGLPVLLGPTGGYLIGFLPAAFIVGSLIERGWVKNRGLILVSGLIGSAIMFTSGVLVLASFVGWDLAIKTGLLPFIGIMAAKLCVLALVVPKFWK